MVQAATKTSFYYRSLHWIHVGKALTNILQPCDAQQQQVSIVRRRDPIDPADSRIESNDKHQSASRKHLISSLMQRHTAVMATMGKLQNGRIEVPVMVNSEPSSTSDITQPASRCPDLQHLLYIRYQPAAHHHKCRHTIVINPVVSVANDGAIPVVRNKKTARAP